MGSAVKIVQVTNDAVQTAMAYTLSKTLFSPRCRLMRASIIESLKPLSKEMLKIFSVEKLYATINFNLRRFTILVRLNGLTIPSRVSTFNFGFYTLCGMIKGTP